MKASQFFITTFKQAPNDAEIVSHQLMMRAGMIQRIASGIYTYMPLGLRSIRKIEAIIRQEMNQAGATELLMPAVQPAALWQESERWSKYGAELLRFKDRHQRDFVLGPTHEELITDIARNSIKSYRQLPFNFYQLQTKFRDEVRPRFGVMRGREFMMKDAYSFDKDFAGLELSYQKMVHAYQRIFTRLGLTFRMVAADNGSIGGRSSHEFHVIAETGEDAIAYCPTSDYAANIEVAEALPATEERATPSALLTKTSTPGTTKCESVADFLKMPLESTVKSLVVVIEQDGKAPEVTLLLLRGDHTLNEIKARKVLGDFRFASATEITESFGAPPGYLGPIGIDQSIKVVADSSVAQMNDFVVGANEKDYHFTGVNWGRDLLEPIVADLRQVVNGDPAPDGQGKLTICRGIEVGHVFQLGTSYAEKMGATYLDDTGKPQPLVMGCYGIGITRILGAAIEQNFDERGIIWPAAMAPFEVVLCPIGYERSESVRNETDRLYAALIAEGVDVILDDRGERPGAMFADWELIGVPYRLVIGERTLNEGKVEYQARRDAQPNLLAVADVVGVVTAKLRESLTV